MRSGSRLYVPRPPARPGEGADFSYLRTSEPGALARPAVDVSALDTVSLASGMIRVLDGSHGAVGPWDPRLPPALLQDALRCMVLTRVFDDRMQRAQRQGRISFYAKSTGEEAVAVAPGMALHPTDMLFPSYRMLGLFLVRGVDLVALMCQLLSNTRDMCKGRQLPLFYHSAAARLFSISGNVGTQFPQAVGWSMAAALKGESAIAASWIGEGASAEGDFHHALLFASVHRAPVVLNIVNNQWAISTFQGVAGGEQTSFAMRGPGYNVAALRVDGNDFLAVYAATRWAAERARSGVGATLIEHVTYRAAAHSTSDDPSRYRPADEPARWPLGDPIERLEQHLVGLGAWSGEQHASLVKRCEDEVDTAWREALSYGTLNEGPRLDPSSMFDDVFKELPPRLRRQREQMRDESKT